ncbi:MAG: glycosyltransferase family 4 protein [Gemmatimonadales bacterium]
MRVLHVLGTGEEYAKGIAHTVMNLARHVDASRYRLSAVILRGDGPVGDQLRAAGVTVKAVGWEDGWTDVPGALRFMGALRQSRADIVHLHAGGLSPRFVSKIAAGARVVVHYHSLEQESGNGSGTPRSTLAADLVIVNSEATAASVRGRKPLVVYPGVNVPPRAKPRDATGPVILGVAARLAPVKGISYLLSAMKQILIDDPDTVLQIAGAGPDRHKLESEAEWAGVAGSTRFVGWQDDVATLMNRWDIYVQPSLSEGLGIAVLEAMAIGLPVVATAVGGLREIVLHGETGYLVPPRDPDALAGSVCELMRDPRLRARMGDAGRRRATEHFSLEREVTAIQSAYDRLLA